MSEGEAPLEVSGLAPLLARSRVVVVLGPGGVGKTTTAAAIAAAGALAGRRVAVLTVDPAARLRDALELPSEAGIFHPVTLPRGTAGRLEAMLLDAKGLFDGLVRRLAPDAAIAERILRNPVYRNVAGTFAGSDAYMALEQMLDVVQSGAFDLVVVDTPPASHALELFDAPERILALLDSKALEYLEQPVRILGGASSFLARGLLRGVLAALERMTGLSLLSDISALAGDFSLVSAGFRQRAHAIRALERAADTSYVLVTAPQPHGAADTLAFAHEIRRLEVPLHAVVVNRVLTIEPAAATDPTVDGAADSPAPGRGQHKGRAKKTPKARRKRAPAWPPTLPRRLVSCANELQTLMDAERAVIERLRAGLEVTAEPSATDGRAWVELPALVPAPASLAAIWQLARRLHGGAS